MLHRRRDPRTWSLRQNIALVGCGAVAEAYYLPALRFLSNRIDQLILVDPDQGRLKILAERFDVGSLARDYRDIPPEIDGVILATPHDLHASMACDLISKGIPVLCEKPLADTGDAATTVVEKANTLGVPLCVNNQRRLFPSSIKIKELLEDRAIGELLEFYYLDGDRFDWPSTTGFYFRSQDPRGVILDRGAHVLDLACWWLGGEAVVLSCQHDSFGGCEAVAVIKFRTGLCQGEVRLSWLTRLKNTYRIVGTEGEIFGITFDWRRVNIKRNRKVVSFCANVEYESFSDFGKVMVGNFLDVIEGISGPIVSAADVLPSIRLIDECYARASRFSMPWYDAWYTGDD